MAKKEWCPKCGSEAKRKRGSYGTKVYCCDLWAWNYGPLVDRETHKARALAHEAFDPLWKSGRLSRTEAYKVLAGLMGMTLKQCHMKKMDAATAQRVPEMVKQIKEVL